MSANESPSGELTFEQTLSLLEQIVRELEDAQLGLDESLERYEQGVRLIKECHARLQQAEERILLLTGVEEGNPVLQAFRHEATAPRVRRRAEDPPR